MLVTAMLILASCASGEPRAKFANGGDAPIIGYGSPDVGAPTGPLKGEVFLDDGSARSLEPGDSIDFYDSQSPTTRYVVIVYQGRDYETYRWNIDSEPNGKLRLEGANCPGRSAPVKTRRLACGNTVSRHATSRLGS